MSHDVFLSHSSHDAAMANAVCAALEQARIKCWMAPRDILPGDSWGASIVDAIENSEVMVIIFSANSNSSKQVTREVERAVQKDVVVVPFKIDSVSPSRDMEYFLSSTHWLDAVSPETEKHLSELCSIINSILKHPSAQDNPLPPDQNTGAVVSANDPAAHRSDDAVVAKPVTDTAALFNQSKQTESKPGLSSKMIAAAVAVLFIAIGGTWFLTQQNNDTKAPGNSNVVVPEPQAVIAEKTEANSDQGSDKNQIEPATETTEQENQKTSSETNTLSNSQINSQNNSENKPLDNTPSGESTVSSETEVTAQPVAAPALITNALNTCDAHVANKRLTTGEGGNAVDCYNEVLQIDPDNQRAIEGLSNIETQYASLIKKAIKEAEKPRAERYLSRLKKVNPSSAEIADLENQIDDLDAAVTVNNTTSNASDTPTRIPTVSAGNWSKLPFIDRTKGLSIYASAYSIEKSGSVVEAPNAVKLYRKVAKLGYSKAQFRLAKMIENGKGTKTDPRLALAWYLKASKQGHGKAKSAAARIKNNLGLN